MTIIDLETRTFIDGAAWRDRYIDQDEYQELLAAAALAAVDADDAALRRPSHQVTAWA